jgi:protein-tyrosine-phosphatase
MTVRRVLMVCMGNICRSPTAEAVLRHKLDAAGLCPPPYRRKLGRLTEHCRLHDSPVVPDPYAGGAQGFEEVLDLVEDACDGLVTMLRRQHGAA